MYLCCGFELLEFLTSEQFYARRANIRAIEESGHWVVSQSVAHNSCSAILISRFVSESCPCKCFTGKLQLFPSGFHTVALHWRKITAQQLFYLIDEAV